MTVSFDVTVQHPCETNSANIPTISDQVNIVYTISASGTASAIQILKTVITSAYTNI